MSRVITQVEINNLLEEIEDSRVVKYNKIEPFLTIVESAELQNKIKLN